MAVLRSFVACKGLVLYTPVIARRQRNTPISASVHRRQVLTGLRMNSSGINNVFPVRGAAQISAVGSGPPAPSGGNLPIPSMPSWAKWVVGAIIVAIPIYRKIRTLEDTVEKTAEVAIEVVDTVAEATEKVAGELADAFPGNENLKEAASMIKTVADVIEGDAEKAEAIIQKVDEIKKEVDGIVDPIIDKIEKEQ
ncbi:FK506-binding protein 2-like [Oryza brachyantha]|uniref:Pterin-binding domain-containing protein n=1 Tax=Oryza brachyantha TaxID=4533 RepID=J3LYE5_ORYBR|nr:FK506-binding protein 2-like [Oryza brachyantha]